MDNLPPSAPPAPRALQLAAALGTKGDSMMAHLTPGEVIVPPEILTPELRQALEQAFGAAGADLGQYTAGGNDDQVNPSTGQPMFAYGDRSDGMSGRNDEGPNVSGHGETGDTTGGFGSAENGNWGPGGGGFSGEDENGVVPGYRTLPEWQRDLSTPSQRGVFNAFESAKGGGLFGSLGRGIEGMFGLSRQVAFDPTEQAWGVQREWNPGSLAGLAMPGVGGIVASQLAQRAYDAVGAPKPSWFSASDGQAPAMKNTRQATADALSALNTGGGVY